MKSREERTRQAQVNRAKNKELAALCSKSGTYVCGANFWWFRSVFSATEDVLELAATVAAEVAGRASSDESGIFRYS